uniref:TMEM165/GDT1 family protein n=1 Tax=Candidatus Magnetaquicoccus inordinatus TaxID=2496818 RepID=UPI00102BE379|nr:TMEM165/GDT1 family protein [Candidatus Magnetaquicoccus inordinatus]
MSEDLSLFSQIIAAVPITATTFALIFLAELGDKTQLVCMTLAARHRPMPVFLGALFAFIILNVLAVIFGSALSAWIPKNVLVWIVAALFAFFGIQSLRAAKEEEEEEEVAEQSGHSILIRAFLMIFLAELGDKTQIAVIGMASTAPMIPVWIGATLALGASSALGVLVGRTLLQKISKPLLNRASGLFFLGLAALSLAGLYWQ